MDNLTHSLIGAALGQAGLKRKTGLAMPALIVGANIPDIDVLCFLWLDGVEHLGFRRGITHGPIAMVLLPLLLAGGLVWFDRWQARRGMRPEGRLPVHFGWLLALSFLACLSHPLFDWFNNYGVRLLEPFSSRWFYGDTLFIIDPWIIAMLGAGIWVSLRRERGDGWKSARPAKVGLLGVAVYIAFNSWISLMAVSQTNRLLAAERRPVLPALVVANAKPLWFWRKEMLWRNADSYGRGAYDAFQGGSHLDRSRIYTDLLPPPDGLAHFSEENEAPPFVADRFDMDMSDPRIAERSKHDPQTHAFLFWSRMPVAELHEDRIVLRDQRFMDARVADRFSVTLRLAK